MKRIYLLTILFCASYSHAMLVPFNKIGSQKIFNVQQKPLAIKINTTPINFIKPKLDIDEEKALLKIKNMHSFLPVFKNSYRKEYKWQSNTNDKNHTENNQRNYYHYYGYSKNTQSLEAMLWGVALGEVLTGTPIGTFSNSTIPTGCEISSEQQEKIDALKEQIRSWDEANKSSSSSSSSSSDDSSTSDSSSSSIDEISTEAVKVQEKTVYDKFNETPFELRKAYESAVGRLIKETQDAFPQTAKLEVKQIQNSHDRHFEKVHTPQEVEELRKKGSKGLILTADDQGKPYIDGYISKEVTEKNIQPNGHITVTKKIIDTWHSQHQTKENNNNQKSDDKDSEKKKDQNSKPVKEPGIPTEEDGFIPKKNWDGEKIRHPKTGQIGYPDNEGGVWIPTGIGPLAHGGPHWDHIDKKWKTYKYYARRT